MCNVAEVAELHRRAGFLHALRKVAHLLPIIKNRVNPLVFEAVGRLTKDREDISEAFRQRSVNIVLNCSGIAEVQHMDVIAYLADALNAALSLPKA